MRPAGSRRRGFTLVELLVAVALIGVLAALGVFLMRGKPRAIDVAHEMSAKIAETSRKAVAAGAVRNEVAQALLSGPARTRTTIIVAAAGGSVVLHRLEEDPAPSTAASWVELSTKELNAAIRVEGFRPGADLTGGAPGPTVAVAPGGSIEIYCRPNGTCDPMTIYLSSDNGKRRARVVVLPLGGSPATFDSW